MNNGFAIRPLRPLGYSACLDVNHCHRQHKGQISPNYGLFEGYIDSNSILPSSRLTDITSMQKQSLAIIRILVVVFRRINKVQNTYLPSANVVRSSAMEVVFVAGSWGRYRINSAPCKSTVGGFLPNSQATDLSFSTR